MWYDKRDLINMLQFPRAHESPMEIEFIRNYIDNIRGMQKDGFGNRFFKSGNSDTAFLSHTDTVQGMHDSKVKQEVSVIDDFVFKKDFLDAKNEVKKDKYPSFLYDTSPLGADDTAGVWLMLNLLSSGVPGLYIFFRNEEHGSNGSHYMINNNPQLFNNINKAVALDRRGYYDVITHQGGRRTCSDEFAKALARQLGGGYKLCSGGVHCDSAVLTYLVPECTNLSVGYFEEHRASEVLDLRFVESLYHRLKKVRWQSLPFVKK